MAVSKQRRRSSERPEMNWGVRAIRRAPLDPRLLARLFIQMALERAETERAQPDQATSAPDHQRTLTPQEDALTPTVGSGIL